MKLSIIVPGIRVQNWQRLYASVDFKDQWEIIFIGPTCPILSGVNIKYIQSYRSPNACQQQGLVQARGEYITFAADDGVFNPVALDQAINIAKTDYRNIVVCKYLEGDNPNVDMTGNEYYKFKYHKDYRLKGVPQDAYIFNCGIISNRFITELGGWDAEKFDTTTCAHADLGIRAYKLNAQMILLNEILFSCSHEPKRTGTHGPVHDSMIKHDLPNFKKLYAKPNSRTNIDINNWKNTEEIWHRRFR